MPGSKTKKSAPKKAAPKAMLVVMPASSAKKGKKGQKGGDWLDSLWTGVKIGATAGTYLI